MKGLDGGKGRANESVDDARHAARAALGGVLLNLTTDQVFAKLAADPRNSRRKLSEARRVLDAVMLGKAVEAVRDAPIGYGRSKALRALARALRPHIADHRPGWFRFLLSLGGAKGESMFQLSYARRPKSSASMPKTHIDRVNHTSKAVAGMALAGTVLRRIEAARTDGSQLTIDAAICDAIDAGEINTGVEAAQKKWKQFRKDCFSLTNGAETYRLQLYEGALEKYKGRWIALPDKGDDLSRLPSPYGGRPKETG